MNNYSLFAEAVKEHITMHDVIALYAPNPEPRQNRIPCPVHAGKDFNLWFSGWGYYCFVCGSSGDVIHFIRHLFGLDFPAALEKLNADFNLGIPMERRLTLREQHDAQRRHRELMKERERREAKKQAYEDLYNSLWDEWARLDKNRIDYAPKNMEEEWHPLFNEALQKIDYQSYLIDILL